MEGDFYSPTPLVQLNTPSPMVYGTPIELEYLNFDNFKNTKWNASLNQALANDSCSSLMESYLHQLKDNNYFLERPLEVIVSFIELKGDRQLRKIALSIPFQSFLISCSGCALLVVLAIIVLVLPVQNAEYFKPGTNTAEKYVAMKTSANYPDLVYKKTLIPASTTDADPSTMGMFKVESMTLLHQSGDKKQYIELGGASV
ncbi:hypothetical protein V7S43_007248 [Phytophthora oleae]|uniref:Uncharacterized protein n=1 Tax=Phytophthora oleae TaxID=2107226 RepID=A0ABD3FLB3_9STRA